MDRSERLQRLNRHVKRLIESGLYDLDIKLNVPSESRIKDAEYIWRQLGDDVVYSITVESQKLFGNSYATARDYAWCVYRQLQGEFKRRIEGEIRLRNDRDAV